MASEPTDTQWNGTSDIYCSSSFNMIGGMLGFVSRNGVASVDDLTIRSWNAGTSQFDVVEHVTRSTLMGTVAPAWTRPTMRRGI